MIRKLETSLNDVDTIPTYKMGSIEREMLEIEIENMQSQTIKIPLIINGEKIYTEKVFEVKIPHNHKKILANVSLASSEHITEAINSALNAHQGWSNLDIYQRVSIFKKAAYLLATTQQLENVAAIMLNHSKTPYEAEIDLAELIDFFNFNVKFLEEIYTIQPNQYPGEYNRFDWQPLEGFILAVPPFNFYSIGGNLPTAPAIAGNVVLWKPARSVSFSNYKIMEVLLEAGLPPGVINFIPFESSNADIIFYHRDFAGLHFTGSYETLVKIWQTIGQNLIKYRNFPRIVGETGGKDFIVMHNSADIEHVVLNIIRGGFEYQGQKCSALSRVYIPQSRWNTVKERLIFHIAKFTYGDISTLHVAGGSIIDKPAFEKIKKYIEFAKSNPNSYEIIVGGNVDNSIGWFIEPTIIVSNDPKSKLMQEEIFGPVVSIYVYPDEKFEETLKLCDETSPFALTGAIFALDRDIIEKSENILRYSAGNFYINDKPTGAIVSRQPFGGAGASGTNDKAGSILNIMRWLSPRTIKENYTPTQIWERPYMI